MQHLNIVKIPFLKQVSHQILETFGNDLSKITVVMPSKRARLFMDRYLLAAAALKPIWAPQYADLDDLFSSGSNSRLVDPLQAVSLLFSVYKKYIPTEETFDEFYFFGETLLSDFNDIDTYLVDATQLYSNLAQLESLKDDFSHLSQEQIEAIQRFFNHDTQLKKNFLEIWDYLDAIYQDFRNQLLDKGLAYHGMLARNTIESMKLSLDKFQQKKYLFVGFNLLTKVEKELFVLLKQQGKALFYWDDIVILKNKKPLMKQDAEEALRFSNENIALFGQDLKFDNSVAPSPKKLTIVEAGGQAEQCGYIAPWIKELAKTSFQDPDSAIVLCDEKLLPSVLTSIPYKENDEEHEGVDFVNITMGFELTQTPIAGLITLLMNLQQKGIRGNSFNYTYLQPVLQHPYIKQLLQNNPATAHLDKEIRKNKHFYIFPDQLHDADLFYIVENENAEALAFYLITIVKRIGALLNQKEKCFSANENLNIEALFRVYQILNRLHGLIHSGDLEIKTTTFIRLIKKLLISSKVPYHGEPAQGLQIMGMLETRNMDFANLMLLSVNDDIMPKKDAQISFIPPFLRQHFEMNGIEHQDALYAHYFYRLMQRADNIVLVYNSGNQSLGKAEMSRFLLQLLVENPFGIEIQRLVLNTRSELSVATPIVVEKTAALIDKIRKKYDISLTNHENDEIALSPSALNVYLDCSLQFYFRYIAGIKSPEELTDDLNNAILGNLFHRSAEIIHTQMGDKNGGNIIKSDIVAYLKDENKIGEAILNSFDEVYFHSENPTPIDHYNGEQLIYFKVVNQMIHNLLRLDIEYAPFTIKGLEQPTYRTFDLHLEDGAQIKVKTGGIIDRMDEKGGTLRIIDYKTGAKGKELKEHRNSGLTALQMIFEPQKDRPKYVFQAFLYASMVCKTETAKVVPALLYPLQATDEMYEPIITCNNEPITNFAEIAPEFDQLLIETLQQLFDIHTPFAQCKYNDPCKYCDFKNICNR